MQPELYYTYASRRSGLDEPIVRISDPQLPFT